MVEKSYENKLNGENISQSSASYEVMRVLRDRGYRVIEEREDDSTGQRGIAILSPINQPRSMLQNLMYRIGIRPKQKAYNIGVLWLDNEYRGAKQDERWVFEAKGTETVPRLSTIISDLTLQRNVSLDVLVNGESPTLQKLPASNYPSSAQPNYN